MKLLTAWLKTALLLDAAQTISPEET
nr:unnamed protein product [Callosobruchus analis]